MKNVLIPICVTGALVGSAFAAPVANSDKSLTTPDPTIAEFSKEMVAALPPASVEVAAVSAISDASDMPNLWGPRFTFSLYQQAKAKWTHEFNANLSFLWGDESYAGSPTISTTAEMFEMPMTLGYNAHYAISDKLSAYAGATLGINYLQMDYKQTGHGKMKEREVGFKWGIGTGLVYNLKENVFVEFSYEFARTYCDREQPNEYCHSDKVTGQHILSLGVGYRF